jgi:hypothetical protein
MVRSKTGGGRAARVMEESPSTVKAYSATNARQTIFRLHWFLGPPCIPYPCRRSIPRSLSSPALETSPLSCARLRPGNPSVKRRRRDEARLWIGEINNMSSSIENAKDARSVRVAETSHGAVDTAGESRVPTGQIVYGESALPLTRIPGSRRR